MPLQWTDRAFGPDPTGTSCRRASSEDHVVFSGSSPPTGSGTGTATPAVAHTPTTGTSTGEAQKSLAELSNTSATGPETPAAAPASHYDSYKWRDDAAR